MFIVLGVEFHEHGVGAGREMTFHHFGNLVQTLHHILIHAAPLQVQPYVSAGGIAQTLGIDVESAARDDAPFHEMLHPLVDGRARHAAFRSHVLEGDTCVL